MHVTERRVTGLGPFGWVGVCLLLGALSPAWAGVVTTVGTGSGSLVANGTTKIDIIDPENDNVINTGEWGMAPTIVGPPNGAGFYNASGGWASIFDNNTGSKVCCNFNPGSTSFTVDSATSAYSLSGYTIATGNDDYGRRPTGWRLFGSDDGFVTSNVLLDTVTADYGAGNRDLPWTTGGGGNLQVGEVTALDNPGGSYSSFRIVFDENSTDGVSGNNGAFQMSQVELIGTLAPLEIGGNNIIGVFQPPLSETNVTGGARFIRVTERPGADTSLNLSEIEVFNVGVTPDGLGPASYSTSPNLSGNDYSAGLTHYGPGTTTGLQHGLATRVYDGVHQTAGNVWSTNTGLAQPPNPEFTLDLGGSRGVGEVRVYPRNENCCTNRFESITIEVFADDPSNPGNPGALLDSFDGPDGDSRLMVGYIFNEPLLSGDIMGSLESDHTYVFEIDALTGMMDMIAITNPDPQVYGQTILDLQNATAVIELINGVPGAGMYPMLSADSILGVFGTIILPETSALGFDTSQLYETGLLGISLVPEPATLSILGLGLLAARRRRRR